MSDRPSDDGGSARSDAASRLAALLADVVDDPAPPAPSAAPSPGEPGGDARARRRVVRRRDLVEPAAPVVAPDPEATQPIPVLPAAPIAEDPVAAEADEAVLAETRALMRAGAAAPAAPAAPPPRPVPLAKQPDPPTRRPVAPVVVAEPEPEPEPDEPAVAAPAAVVSAPEPEPAAPEVAPVVARSDDGLGGRAPRLTLRAVAFGLALALLVAAVPALGWVGKERLLDSRGGQIVEGGTDPSEPGYRALVNPTPTALVVHRDATGYPVAASVLSLGAGDAGGTVLLVPLSLHPVEGSFFTRIIDGYDSVRSDDGFRRSIEDVIGVSVPPPVIDMTDENLATLVAPVAPLELDVTDPVVAEDGTPFDGPVSLAAEQVGPYLRATREGEPEIAHLERIRDVWVAWLTAIGDATATEPIGAANTGVGSFLRVLAAGEPVVETLDVEAGVPEFGQPAFYVPAPGMNEQVIDAVPFPVSPRTGRRFDVELLNGAEGATLPMPLMRDIILAGGALSSMGNAGSFGQEETTILYKDADWRDTAELLQAVLGDSVEIEKMSERRAEAETEDMVITIGSDLLSRYEE